MGDPRDLRIAELEAKNIELEAEVARLSTDNGRLRPIFEEFGNKEDKTIERNALFDLMAKALCKYGLNGASREMEGIINRWRDEYPGFVVKEENNQYRIGEVPENFGR